MNNKVSEMTRITARTLRWDVVGCSNAWRDRSSGDCRHQEVKRQE